ncbi:hypothetical protein WG66_009813, partial [Moniliophthora roreri]
MAPVISTYKQNARCQGRSSSPMASQGLLTLPTELLQEIGEYLGYDTNNLWAANKRLYNALYRYVS